MRGVTALITAAVVCTPVSAQIPTSSAEIRSRSDAESLVQGALELKRVSHCALERRKRLGETMIASLPASNTEVNTAATFSNVIVGCMRTLRPAMRIDVGQLRGAVAEELYLTEYSDVPNFAALDHSSKALPAEWISSKLEGEALSQVIWQDFAQCVVSDAPAQADAILRTTPRSKEEGKAIGKITPFLGPCIAAGSTFSMDAATLRSYVAQALNRGMKMWPKTTPTGAQ